MLAVNPKPREYDNARFVRYSTTSWVPPAPSVRMSTLRPTRPAVGNGNCANASAMMLMWSVAVLLPALPGRNAKANGSPVPAWPWSTNAQNGWCPKPLLYVGAACSFSNSPRFTRRCAR